MDKGSLYIPRKGTIDLGRDYEYLNVAHIILNLIMNEDIKDFKIAANAEGFGLYDDIILEIQFTSGEQQQYAIQLKHLMKDQKVKDLMAPTGGYSVICYYQNFIENYDKLKPYKLIFFTNLKFTKTLTVPLGPATVENKNEESDSFLNTGESNNCQCLAVTEIDQNWKSKLDIEKCKHFVSNFKLYVNQVNSTSLRTIISAKFKKLFNCDEDTCEKYVQFIRQWYQEDTKQKPKEKLSKRWIQQAIAIRLLTPSINLFSQTVNKRQIFLQDIIIRFNVTICKEETRPQLLELCKTELEMDTKNVNNALRRFWLRLGYVSDTSTLTDLERTLLLWVQEKCPLVVSENQTVLKAIQLYPQGLYILLTDKSQVDIAKEASVFRCLSDIEHNSEIYHPLLENLHCSLQGQEISLKRLVEKHEHLKEKITPDELCKMALNKIFEIGGNQEKLPEPHIERKLSTTIIKIQFLQHILKEEQKTCIVLSCDNKKDTINKFLQNFELIQVEEYLKAKKFSHDKNSTIVYFSENQCSLEDFEKICDKNKSMKNCHHFRVTHDGHLEWINTRGRIEEMEPFRLTNHYVDESELCNSRFNNINVICANPGMGKSILAKSLKNKLSERYWPIIIHPMEVSAYFRSNHNHGFEEYIEKKIQENYTDFDKAVMNVFKEKNLITYIWDGLDEISDENFSEVLKIIENVSKKKILQWVTSRTHLKDKLEKKFNVFSRSILQFDEEQQKSFIRERLANIPNVEGIISKIRKNIEMIKCPEVLAVPLQIYMLTELFRQDSEKYSKLLNGIFSITDLYHHFVNEKFDHFYKEKAKVSEANDHLQNILEAYKSSYIKKYEKAALKTLEKSDLNKLNVACEPFLIKIKENSDSFGLITKVSDNMIPSFIHTSYSEFFVASYFVRNWKNIPELKTFIFKERYRNIRFFFDLIMACNSPIHVGVLYKNLNVLKDNEKKLEHTDKGGRSALHLACSWGQRYPVVKTVKSDEDETYQISEKAGEGVEEEKEKDVEILKYLLEKCDYRTKDNLFRIDSIQYADLSLCLYPIIEISKENQLDIESLTNFKSNGTLLFYGIQFNKSHLLNLVKDIPIIKTEKRSLSLLHLCAEFDSPDCLTDLLKVDNYKNLINVSDVFDVFPITIACKKGRHEVLQILIENGADLSNVFQLIELACKGGHQEVVRILLTKDISKDKKRFNSSLQAACLNGYAGILKLLLNSGADVNVNTRYGTLLYIACHYGYEEIVRNLLQTTISVNRANKFGFTPLHIACQKNHTDIVRLLINSENIDINAIDNKGITPLHVTSKNENDEIMQILLDSKAKVNFQCKKRKMTCLHNACQNKNVTGVKMLIKAGADINCVNSENCTPIYLACEKGHFAIVKELIKSNADINIPNNKQFLPLEIAKEKGFDKIVNYLTNVVQGSDIS